MSRAAKNNSGRSRISRRNSAFHESSNALEINRGGTPKLVPLSRRFVKLYRASLIGIAWIKRELTRRGTSVFALCGNERPTILTRRDIHRLKRDGLSRELARDWVLARQPAARR